MLCKKNFSLGLPLAHDWQSLFRLPVNDVVGGLGSQTSRHVELFAQVHLPTTNTSAVQVSTETGGCYLGAYIGMGRS